MPNSGQAAGITSANISQQSASIIQAHANAFSWLKNYY